ncbi:PASTA domain-containing protein [Methanosarcina sp. Mfa9]|uniref:PASTA domain-containing protein n=1 Tax=Methanosarcina sp. Mfa9 TaxID=3439063 RepID=UPI003F835C6A
MKAQLEKRLKELRNEYESGQKVLGDIETALAELEARKENLNETLLRISGAIELLEEVLGVESEVSTPVDSGFVGTDPGNSVEVPNVVRKPLDQAREMLEDAGLTVGEVTEKSIFVTGVLFGDVIQQDPKWETKVKSGSAVNLVIATKGRFKPDLSKDSKLCPFSKH